MANLEPGDREEMLLRGILDGETETNIEPGNRKEALLRAILEKGGGGGGSSDWTTFKQLQRIVRQGKAADYLAIGDQIVVERATALQATIGNTQGDPGISAASVARDTFLHAMGTSHAGDYEFVYDGAVWHLGNRAVELLTYGISVTGTPIIGDAVVIHETASALKWDVLGIDVDEPNDPQFTHSVTLGLHDVWADVQFCARQAVIYCPDGLAAGNYYFKVTEHPWHSGSAGKWFRFTLASAVPAKGQLVLNAAYNAALDGSAISTFASSTTTVATETVTLTASDTEPESGADLGTVNNAGSGNINSIQRAVLGSNNYGDSAIRQFINSGGAAGSVWTPKSKFDRPPSWAATTAGFLNGMDEDFVAAVGAVKKKTALNTVTDGGGVEDSVERFFLLSKSEVYAGNEATGGEGDPYPYYKDYSDLPSAGTGADTNRIKYLSTTARYWWLRSPYASYAYYPRLVSPDGSLHLSGASSSGGLAPACCII